MVKFRVLVFWKLNIKCHFVDANDEVEVKDWILDHLKRRNGKIRPHDFIKEVNHDKLIECMLLSKLNDDMEAYTIDKTPYNLENELHTIDTVKMMFTNIELVRGLEFDDIDDVCLFMEDLIDPTSTHNKLFLDVFTGKVQFTFAKHKMMLVLGYICRLIDEKIYIPTKEFIKTVNPKGETHGLGFWKEDVKGMVERVLKMITDE